MPVQVGLISDIHGDRAALERVWAALDYQGLTRSTILNAGDNVGYGDDPEGCVAFLRAHPTIQNVQGNYDRNVARYPERADEYRRKWGKTRPQKLDAIRRDSERISASSRAWLIGLPREREIMLNGILTLLTHYAPGSKQGLGRWTSETELAAHASDTAACIVVCGHTHSPFVRLSADTLFINPGTVGRPLYGCPAYAVLILETGQPPRAELKYAK